MIKEGVASLVPVYQEQIVYGSRKSSAYAQSTKEAQT